MKFRKRPVVIEAVQLTADKASIVEALRFCPSLQLLPGRFAVKTLEGRMEGEFDDWLIRGIRGEFYFCKPDIFDATYELVEQEIQGANNLLNAAVTERDKRIAALENALAYYADRMIYVDPYYAQKRHGKSPVLVDGGETARALLAIHAQRECFVCPECGPGVTVDEDGCCATCGTDTTVQPAPEAGPEGGPVCAYCRQPIGRGHACNATTRSEP